LRSLNASRRQGTAPNPRAQDRGAQHRKPAISRRHVRGIGGLLGLSILVIAGCASTGSDPEHLARVHGLDSAWVQGEGFRHRVFRHGADNGPLHVYLEGDGRPWLTRRQVNTDPTPRTALALRLMLRDAAPGLYLGRPCYHGSASDRGCSPWLWTHGRYSEAVIASMAAALQRIAGVDRTLTLIGYSGGGTIAMLLAPRLSNVARVITVAANLDTAAWTRHHGFSPLTGSMNPADMEPLPGHIAQLHLAGGRDRNVPPRLSAITAARQPGTGLRVIPNYDHRCCWERDWTTLISPNPASVPAHEP